MLTAEMLRRLWPNAAEPLVSGIIMRAPAVLAKYGLDQPLVLAHFMAQISHECGAGVELVENLNYSPAGIVRTWPGRFRSVAAAMPFAHHPQLLADKVYDGRMGNRPGSDDGWAFRGRGGTNTTGHDGYYRLALKMAVDLLSDPDKVNDPIFFLECAVVDFVLCGCLPFAHDDDVRGVTRKLNGGYIGLAERETWLKRWKAALAAEHGADAVVPLPRPRPAGALQYGDSGFAVKGLQQQLAACGYACGADDGEFHEATRDAVNAFKANEGLPTDGVVDQATMDALNASGRKPVSEKRATATTEDLREAGSGTVASADNVKLAAKVITGLGAGGAADQSGALDKAKDALDQASMVRGMVESLQDVLHWAIEHWWVAAIVAGFLAWHFGHDIIEKRLADHRAGLNMGR